MADTDTEKAQDEKKEKRTLHLAGYSYMLGDVAMGVAGFLRRHYDEKKPAFKSLGDTVQSAAIWFAGGVAAAVFGNPSIEKQLEIQTHKLQRHLKQNGIRLDESECEKSELLKTPGVLGRASEFLYQHPSEMLNLAYAIGSLFLIKKGVADIRTRERTLSLKGFSREAIDKLSAEFWMGSIILTGALTGLLFKEDPDAKKKAENGNIIQKAVASIRQKPLRYTGTLYGINNIFAAVSMVQDHDKRTLYPATAKAHWFSGLQLASYLFANSMLFLSPRDQITGKGFDPAAMGKLEDAAARIIAAQPAEVQQKVLADVSDYLSKEKGVKVDAATLASHLATRVAGVTEERLQQTANGMKWAARETERKQAQAEAAPSLT